MFKVALKCFLNIDVLINIVFYLKLCFILKIDPKSCIFKNLKTFRKSGRNLFVNPVVRGLFSFKGII